MPRVTLTLQRQGLAAGHSTPGSTPDAPPIPDRQAQARGVGGGESGVGDWRSPKFRQNVYSVSKNVKTTFAWPYRNAGHAFAISRKAAVKSRRAPLYYNCHATSHVQSELNSFGFNYQAHRTAVLICDVESGHFNQAILRAVPIAQPAPGHFCLV